MISYRSYELVKGGKIFSDSFRQKSDEKVLTFLAKNIILLNRFYRIIIRKISNLVKIILVRVHLIWKSLSKKGDSFFDRVKGKRVINNKGSVSLYWQSVSESREDKQD